MANQASTACNYRFTDEDRYLYGPTNFQRTGGCPYLAETRRSLSGQPSKVSSPPAKIATRGNQRTGSPSTTHKTSQATLYEKTNWLRESASLRRPSGYGPDELLGCSTPRSVHCANKNCKSDKGLHPQSPNLFRRTYARRVVRLGSTTPYPPGFGIKAKHLAPPGFGIKAKHRASNSPEVVFRKPSGAVSA